MKPQLVILFIFGISFSVLAQSDFDSPYSIFGIGKENSTLFGNSNAMGNTGIAYSSSRLLNNLNPASLTALTPGLFLYEVGVSNTFSTKEDYQTTQSNNDFNFTNIGIGFAVSKKWKMSFSLIPTTKVSYEIDLEQPIEGSQADYYTNIIGSGGISEISWGHGYQLTKNFSVGLQLMAYFGSIDQEQIITYGSSEVLLEESNHYNGVGLKTGFQYTLNNLLGSKTTFGATVSLPSTLKGSQDVEGTKSFSTSSVSVLSETDESIDDYELPLKIGVGISSQIKNVTVNVDYRKSFWSDSYQSNSSYTYSDQNTFGVGLEYKPSTDNFKYWNTVAYRFGANYDSGYLTVSDTKIDSYGVSAGLGLPFSKNSSSMLNLTYSYGKEGTLDNNLIVDNIHKLSLNLSLNGRWFQKKKIF
ncbi:hypothetical protein SAMN05444411_101615 [Lutibacter oricola]|uniref:Long-chain fatty acid transport protein n=1 Tax=Lutibacter oricola TaxID=762486 RepID=A0A1H2T3Z6_9FLAO|nr:hypothetical protein [Lutibacter oricola]SDW38527.1 hypothetical protein SAMN05444411_101615 [Lutibacter oricola]